MFDPFVVDKEKNKFRKGKRTLENVCAHYNVPLDNAHEATADAVAAARVAWKLTREFPELVEMTSDELTLAQSTWYYQSQVELQAWFEKQGKNTSVNNNWPIAS